MPRISSQRSGTTPSHQLNTLRSFSFSSSCLATKQQSMQQLRNDTDGDLGSRLRYYIYKSFTLRSVSHLCTRETRSSVANTIRTSYVLFVVLSLVTYGSSLHNNNLCLPSATYYATRTRPSGASSTGLTGKRMPLDFFTRPLEWPSSFFVFNNALV